MRPELDERLLRESRCARPEPDPAAMRRGIALVLGRGERAARRRRRPLVAAAALALVLALSLVAVAAERVVESRAAEPATRIVDRTYACTPDRSYATSGMRAFSVGASPARLVLPHDPYTVPAWITLGSTPHGPTSQFVLVRSRQFPRDRWQRGFGPGGPGVHVNTRRCALSRIHVPLSSSRLPGPAIRYDRFVRCEAATRILVRVQATLALPARWTRIDATYAGAQRNVASASVAVREERTGAPLAFARLQGGATTAWYAGRCS